MPAIAVLFTVMWFSKPFLEAKHPIPVPLFVAIWVVFCASALRVAFAGVRIGDDGVTIRNVLTTRLLSLDDVRAFSVGKVWALANSVFAELADGTKLHCYGLRNPDRRPLDPVAKRMTDDLNARKTRSVPGGGQR